MTAGLRPLFQVLGLWRRSAPLLVAGALVSILALGAGVALAAIAGATVAAAAVGGSFAAFALLRAVGGARVLLRYLERLVTHGATFAALAELRVWLFRGLAPSAAGGLGFRRGGDLVARLASDIDALDHLYLRLLVPLAGAVALVPALALILGPRHPGLAVAVVGLFVLAAFVLPALLARHTEAVGARLAEASAALRTSVVDALSARAEVLAYGAEGRMVAAMQAKEGALLAAQRSLTRASALAGAGAFLATQAALLCVLAVALSDPAAAVVGAFVALIAFELAALLPRAGTATGHAVAAARRVIEAGTAAPQVAEPASPAAAPAGHRLRFEAVTFGWRADAPPVLREIDLDVPEGARIGLLGASGAGKSTIAALALRLVAPWSGRVMLGGVDLAALRAAEAHARIALLTQATHLFADTIRANLRLAQPEADDDALWAALAAARVDHVVRALPEGLDAWLGEGGGALSGGEGRRLALARCLLSPAQILVLDEPCAGLDAATAQDFLADLDQATAGRSVVLIAHRLTGVERLDRVYRLSGGRLVAAAG